MILYDNCGGPISCLLHANQRHQYIAEGCGYYPDFYCVNTVVNRGAQ